MQLVSKVSFCARVQKFGAPAEVECENRGAQTSFHNQLYTLLTVFMDISGAFDSTTFAAIREAVKSRGVGPIKIRQIIFLTYQDESAEVKSVEGCRKDMYYHLFRDIRSLIARYFH